MPRPTARTNWENSQTRYTPLKEGYQAFTLELFRHSGRKRALTQLVSESVTKALLGQSCGRGNNSLSLSLYVSSSTFLLNSDSDQARGDLGTI